MIRNSNQTVAILKGVDVTGGLMQLRDEITVPETIGSYSNSCHRVYQNYPVQHNFLSRLSLVEGRRGACENLDFIAAKHGFYMGGIIGLRVVECGSDESLIATMHSYLGSPTPQPNKKQDILYHEQLAAMAKLAHASIEHVRAVDLPYDEWAEQLGVDEAYHPSFMMGLGVMAMLGHAAGEKRAEVCVNEILTSYEQEW